MIKKLIVIFLLISSAHVFPHELDNKQGQIIRLGVWNNPPVVFQDANGEWQGVSVDIFRYIAEKNGWKIVYVPGSFADHVAGLNNQTIDIISAMAHSTSRAEKYAYNKTPIIGNWGLVYTKAKTNINSLLDLNNKSIAVMKNNIHHEAFLKLILNFDIQVRIIEKNNFNDVLASIQNGEADAGVLNRLYGTLHANKYNLVETGIIFNPINIHYVAPHHEHDPILNAIDEQLSPLKSDRGSIYYKSLHKWLSQGQEYVLPTWLYSMAISFTAIVLFMATLVMLFKRQVAYKTIELRKEIDERKATQERLDQLAYYDALTGLPNRVSFAESLKVAIASARRRNHIVAVLFIDLDQFKNTNDSLGHVFGDQLIVQAAQRLKNCLRDEDIINRFGGDEFVTILPALNGLSDVSRVAERMLSSLSIPIVIDDTEIYTSASIGAAIFPDDSSHGDELLKFADAAMYHAKSLGGNCYQFYNTEFTQRLNKRIDLGNRLRHAVEREELLLHYQPIIDLGSNQIVGVEALLRWHDPEHGLIPPDEFIPFAEESDLIVSFGEWVLNQACKQVKTWENQGCGKLHLSVNVSSKQFVYGKLYETVNKAIKESGIDAQQLEVELTERMFLNINDNVKKTLKLLQNDGINLSIDDFGTGYSGLSYLKQLPIGTLKIDRSFVSNIPHDQDDVKISTTIISMARGMGMNVVAEGIETEEQLDFLRQHGCDRGQGYLISRPLPADELAALVCKADKEI